MSKQKCICHVHVFGKSLCFFPSIKSSIETFLSVHDSVPLLESVIEAETLKQRVKQEKQSLLQRTLRLEVDAASHSPPVVESGLAVEEQHSLLPTTFLVKRGKKGSSFSCSVSVS